MEQPNIDAKVRDYHRKTPIDIAQQYKKYEIAIYVETHKWGKIKDTYLRLVDMKITSKSVLFTKSDVHMGLYLKKLNLSNNRLDIIPQEIFTITSLVKLNLSNNKIKTVPPGISSLVNLVSFKIASNRLTLPPLSCASLPKLEILICSGNPLHFVTDDIKNSNSDMIDYLKNFSKNSSKWDHMKVLMVGEPGSGKSTLAKSFKKQTITSQSVIQGIKSRPTVIAKQQSIGQGSENMSISKISLPNKTDVLIWDIGLLEVRFIFFFFF